MRLLPERPGEQLLSGSLFPAVRLFPMRALHEEFVSLAIGAPSPKSRPWQKQSGSDAAGSAVLMVGIERPALLAEEGSA
jgi:hypothetical protein